MLGYEKKRKEKKRYEKKRKEQLGRKVAGAHCYFSRCLIRGWSLPFVFSLCKVCSMGGAWVPLAFFWTI